MSTMEQNREEWVEEYAEGIGNLVRDEKSTLADEIERTIKGSKKFKEYSKDWSEDLLKALGGVTPRMVIRVLKNSDIPDEKIDKIGEKVRELVKEETLEEVLIKEKKSKGKKKLKKEV